MFAEFRTRRNTRRPLRLEALEPRALMAFDPSPLEQELLMYVNRMRTDPQAEFDLLVSALSPITSPDPQVTSALRSFNVDGNLLRTQWNALTPVPPLAWNEDLYEAAHGHNAAMIAALVQSHQLPGEPGLGTRVTNAGYLNWSNVRENIFCYSKSAFYAHAGFAIDWGSGPGGIQSPPGHRNNIMHSEVREAGFAVTEFSGGSFGPLVVTQDFGNRWTLSGGYVLGAVWDDANENGFYNAGEGLGGVSVEFVKAGSAPITVTSYSAGGYQALLSPGTYSVRAFGGALGLDMALGSVVVQSSNVWLNVIKPEGEAPVAQPDRGYTLQNAPVTIPILANDSDADHNINAATIEILSAPAGSQTSVLAGGELRFQPPPGFIGGASVQYRLRDPLGFVSAAATVTIAVGDPLRPRQNPILAFDVDFDGEVTGLDSVLLVNELNAGNGGDLPAYAAGQALVPFFDPSGNHKIEPLDVLLVLIYINDR